MSDLQNLIRQMNPTIAEEEYVFLTCDPQERLRFPTPPIGQFHEREGTTLIVRRKDAEGAGVDYHFPCRMIRLSVHSDLNAVGFLAAVLPPLAAAGISVNVVSAFHHDHLFVPTERAEEALSILNDLMRTK